MFAFKTTSGSAPLHLNSVLQTYAPLEALFALLFIPKWHKITLSHEIFPPDLVLNHLQETAKSTSLPSLFDPLSLANCILILFFKKRVPFRLAHYSFTNCLSLASLMFLCSVCFLFIIQLTKAKKASLALFFFYSMCFHLLYNKKIPCYVYCVKLTGTCYSTYILLLFC